MFLLDTNVISEIRKGTRCDPHVADWYASVDASHLFISSLTIGEVRRGVELARRRGDVDQVRSLDTWLQTVTRQFSERILAVDEIVADQWGHMASIRPAPVIDSLLAATAVVHNLKLVTRNVSDVERLGADVLNPFSPPEGGT